MHSDSSKRIAALIVAGGTGSRMGGEVPKQYQPLGDKTVLEHTLRCFATHPQIDDLWLVRHADHTALAKKACATLNLAGITEGGASRQASVLAGLEAIATSETQPDTILIHDAARPFVSAALVSRVIEHAARTKRGTIPALPVADTLKQTDGHSITNTVPRETLVAVQTPQAFPFTTLLEAHRNAPESKNFTDDAALMEHFGHAVDWVQGDPQNFKLTHEGDMEKARQHMQQNQSVRTGMGFDVHQLMEHPAGTLAETHYITLGGLEIPHHQRLKGHSDADVVLHAVVDALLGAMGEGDIGQHFPPSDPQWKNVDSAKFVEHARQLLAQKGGRLNHLDITLMGEEPKVSPYRDAMQQRIAQLLELPASRINVKATTTEKLGFTGRGEGLACHAIATVLLPEEESTD